MPDGFSALVDPQQYEVNRYSGYRDIPAADAGDVVAVQTTGVWKNLFWSLQYVLPDGGLWSLSLCAASPRGYPRVGPVAEVSQRKAWPGLDVWDRDDVWVEVFPGEVALIRVDVTPVDDVGREAGPGERACWWRASPALSPWLPGQEAIAAVRGFSRDVAPSLGKDEPNSLEVSRLRDGWRVWNPASDNQESRSSSVAYYVGDDGVVMPSSAAEPIDEASRRLSAALLERQQAGPQIVDSGPVGIDEGARLS